MVSQDAARRASRVAYTARLLVRGACGLFAATGIDVSRTGLRMAMATEVLRLDPDADLAAAAACVQTRVGSRFVLDLGLTATGRGRVRKNVELVRLVVADDEDGALELGCRFLQPLSAREAVELSIEMPNGDGEDPAAVRRAESWTEDGREALDPRLAEEKVESLLDVPVAGKAKPDERRPVRTLRALVRGAQGQGAAPLIGRASRFTEATVRMRLTEEQVRALGAEPGDFTAITRGMHAAYGTWPALEILEGTRRLWHGTAHVCGLEIAGNGDRGAILRMALGRRLQPAELDRLCG